MLAMPGSCDQPLEGGERGRLPSDLPSLFLVPVTSNSPRQTDTEQGTLSCFLNCVSVSACYLSKKVDARAASEQSSDLPGNLDVGLPDDPDSVDDDDAAPPDAGVWGQQAEAGHQLHDEPRQHGQLPRQGQAAARGGGECPARGPQVGRLPEEQRRNTSLVQFVKVTSYPPILCLSCLQYSSQRAGTD